MIWETVSQFSVSKGISAKHNRSVTQPKLLQANLTLDLEVQSRLAESDLDLLSLDIDNINNDINMVKQQAVEVLQIYTTTQVMCSLCFLCCPTCSYPLTASSAPLCF